MRLGHRIPALVGAYFSSSAAAGFALSIVGVLASQMQQHYSIGGALFLIVFGGMFLAMVIAVAAFLPAIAVIYLAEREALTSPWFYLGVGLLAGVLAYGVYALLSVIAPGAVEAFFAVDLARLGAVLVPLFIMPGLAGGLVFWLVAGKAAGSKPRIRPPRGDLA